MSIKRHSIYNLLGSVAPMLISMATVPLDLHRVGDARYGVLALVWGFLGYFGLFDPGITRAAQFHMARLHGPENDKERESVFWTAMSVNLAIGMVGGIVLYIVAQPLFRTTFKMPADMRAEVIASLPWLAASIPVSIMTGVLSGALMAREKFGFYNVNSFFNNIFSQVVPLAVAIVHGPDLKWLIPSVLITRAVGAIPNCLVLIRAMPLGVGGKFDRVYVRPLFVYGGWITISNLLTPIMATMDRMVIGSLLNAQAVAYYTVPSNLVSRVSVVPGALATSIFPRLTREKLEDSAQLASEAVAGLAAITTPLMIGVAAALPIFMQLWVGKSFATQAAPVGLILVFGVWINGLAFIPFEHLQATNRPDVVSKFHALEILPFLAVLWLGLHYFGLLGAACTWTLRVTADAILLFVMAGQISGWRRLIPGGVMIILTAVFSPTSFLSFRTPVVLAIFCVSIVWAWKVSPSVRRMILGILPNKARSEAI
jgi:O-antigen/teichoic acid export membrane protein